MENSVGRHGTAGAVATAATCLLMAVGIGGLGVREAQAQNTQPGGLIRHDRGQAVSPVYEGWYPLPDGRIAASFGYFNRNYEEEVHVPVGPNNRVQPGPEDQGQPTYFFPRRHIGLFVVVLPADLPRDADLFWSLSVRGETLEIPVNLNSEYLIEPHKAAAGESPGNTPPLLRFDPMDDGGRGPAGRTVERAATVGAPLPLAVWVSDDGLGSGNDEPELTVTWSLYRGSAGVAIAEESPEVAADGTARTTATFSAPGEYMLYVVASDGSRQSNQCCWTNGYVRVTVTAE